MKKQVLTAQELAAAEKRAESAIATLNSKPDMVKTNLIAQLAATGLLPLSTAMAVYTVAFAELGSKGVVGGVKDLAIAQAELEKLSKYNDALEGAVKFGVGFLMVKADGTVSHLPFESVTVHGVAPIKECGANGESRRISYDECVASGTSCVYRAEGPHGEMQCRYCGKEKKE